MRLGTTNAQGLMEHNERGTSSATGGQVANPSDVSRPGSSSKGGPDGRRAGLTLPTAKYRLCKLLQQGKQLAVKFVTVEVLILHVRPVGVKNPERAAEVPQRKADPMTRKNL